MRKHVKLFTGMLTIALALQGGAAAIIVEAAEVETEFGTEAESETEKVLPESKAVLNGELIDVLDEAYEVSDVSGEHGWISYVWAEGKGYGSPWLVVSLDGKHEIKAEEGAEAYIGTDGILRFFWKDADTGEEVKPNDLAFKYSADDPITAIFCVTLYDWDGEPMEEKELTTYTQTEGGDFFSVTWPLMEQETAAHGATLYGHGTKYLTVEDDGGDAVCRDDAGNEIARYPDTSADFMRAHLSGDGTILTVVADGKTEVFQMN